MKTQYPKFILLILFIIVLVSFVFDPETIDRYLEKDTSYIGKIFILFAIITISYEFPIWGSLLSILLLFLYYSKLYPFFFQSFWERDFQIQTEEENNSTNMFLPDTKKEQILSIDESLRPKSSHSLLSRFENSKEEPNAYSPEIFSSINNNV